MAKAAESNPKAHNHYAQSWATSRKTEGGAKGIKGIRSTGNQAKAEIVLKIFEVVYRRDQRTQR